MSTPLESPGAGPLRPLRLGEVDFWAFPALEALPGLLHAVSTRQVDLAASGDQAGPNLERLRRTLGLKRLAWVRQVHGTDIVAVNGEEAWPAGVADGLTTDQPGVGLLIKQADCQAVILAAPERGVVANLHAGWRGNAAGMPAKGVEFLRERYGVEPHEIHAAVSPSLGACCGEFVNWREKLPAWFAPFRVGENHFDLEAATRHQLEAAGVRPQRIFTSGRCTVCSPEFFSYRRDKTAGRFGTVVALRE
ncbi:polyphenol oxidase family protein [Desulfoferula mesophila]|uniref:Multicopper polyphenol oxidase n=1 Tax=Desulfoferula mesophila TaxID=3058419 RepID=A0AAU9EHX4_9BACT|nr:multicopper polyphenol oxidase [Desulfoferula mesophilus]